ncbi:MAG: hypothetical protein AAF570_11765, partial [Bacteroidota bacterium]
MPFTNGKTFAGDPLLSFSFLPNPKAPGMPLHLITAQNDADIIAQIWKMRERNLWYTIWSSWGYEIREKGKRVMLGYFDEDDAGNRRVGTENHFDFSNQATAAAEKGPFELVFHNVEATSARKDSMLSALNGLHTRLTDFLGPLKLPKKLPVHLYRSVEEKGLERGNTAQTHFDGKALHTVVHPAYAGHEDHRPAQWLIRKHLGKETTPVMEAGAAVLMTQRWYFQGWEYWAAKLQRSGNALSVAELLNRKIFLRESRYVRGCMAAAFVAHLIEEKDQSQVQKWLKNGFAPSKNEISRLQKSFERYLEALAAKTPTKAEQPGPKFAPIPAYHKGFNFAHEGYQIYNGYASSRATRSLEYNAEELHCNVTAIIPYAGMGTPQSPADVEINDWPGGENDPSIVHSIWSAKQAGLMVLMKPQVWVQSGWPGSVNMRSKGDWEIWYEKYMRWIRHYTMMSEIFGAEIMCVGVEFMRATLDYPEQWRTIIRQLRGLYSGKMTYAANWGDELEQMAFWDELDFIGANCYYPLASGKNVDDKALMRGFAQNMKKIEAVARKFGKPVLFTEIGFRSKEAAWEEVHAEAGGRPVDVGAQRRCYVAMIE